MARNITFHLPACAVHTGLQERESALIAQDALAELGARPLMGCKCQPPDRTDRTRPVAHAGRWVVPTKISMRFATETPPQSTTPFTFSTLWPGPPVESIGLGWHRRIKPHDKQEDERCTYVDQYSVGDPSNPATGTCGRFCEVLYGSLIKNKIPQSLTKDRDGNPLEFSELLGKEGHFERFSAWSHVVGFVGFLLYAVIRQIVAENRNTVEGVFASISGWTLAFVFLSSSIYHGTAADPKISMFTRFIDFAAIYAGLAIGATADIAVATRGFDNVPIVTIIDIPIAATLLFFFFIWRRIRIPMDETWTEDWTYVPSTVKCTLGRGLFSRGHEDLHHSQLRESTSLLLTASYFMTVPAAVMTLGWEVAGTVITLQGVGFVLLVAGLLLDKVFEWPNKDLVIGKRTCCYPNNCGCILTAHGVWHIIALVSAACTVGAREYALHS